MERLRNNGVSKADVPESSAFFYDLTAREASDQSATDALRAELSKGPMIGLTAHEGAPSRPPGPALAARIKVDGDAAIVEVSGSDDDASGWKSLGKLTVPLARGGEALKADQVVGAIAEGVLAKVMTARVVTGPKVKGKVSYRLMVSNESPLILNGIALAASRNGVRELDPDFVGPPEPQCASMNGFSLAPGRAMAIPIETDLARRWGKNAVPVLAADLSGL